MLDSSRFGIYRVHPELLRESTSELLDIVKDGVRTSGIMGSVHLQRIRTLDFVVPIRKGCFVGLDGRVIGRDCANLSPAKRLDFVQQNLAVDSILPEQ